MPLIISDRIAEKLADEKHGVTQKEIEHCFINRDGPILRDTRDQHKTNPPTLWFLAYTNQRRLLKIMYVQDGEDIYLKSAYDPSEKVIELYEKFRKSTK